MKRLAVLMFIALSCSLSANCALLLLLRKFYAERILSQVWIGGSSPKAAASVLEPSTNTTVLLLGDSRIAEWGVPPIKHSCVVNAGAAGATSAELVFRYRELLERYRPQIAVIQIGINDLKLIGVRPELRDEVISCSLSNINLILEECRRRHVQVLLMPVWPAAGPAGLRRVIWSDSVDASLAALNRQIGNLPADPNSFRIVDPFNQLTKGMSADARKKLFRDMLHLKPEVYGRLSPLLEDSLRPWLDRS